MGGEFCKPEEICKKDAIYHLLKNLKQRFSPNDIGKLLVHDVRQEIKKRYVPKRDIKAGDIEKRFGSYVKIASDALAEIYKFAPEIHKILNFPSYSKFQIYGWRFVYDVLTNNTSLIITAPTGSGKTEVFVPPLIYKIVENLKKKEDFMALIIYPRISLLKDQASRIFKYVYNAQKFFNTSYITIGLQFGGVATNIDNTLQNKNIFEDKRSGIFKLFNCPICGSGNLTFRKRGRKGHFLRCINCNAEWKVSLAKDEHIRQKVNILITTFESLDRLFLHPKFDELFNRLNAIFIDEVHLFHGIYGAHISNFIENIEISKEEEVAKIGISATIASPEHFGSKLFYKSNNTIKEKLITIRAEEFALEDQGCEFIYFIKSAEEENRSLDTSCFIQTVMAVGHGILEKEQQALAFIDSIDLVKRFKGQISDAEQTKELWKFRTIVDEIKFKDKVCPKTDPCNCEIYKNGECWRIINSKPLCYENKQGKLKEQSLEITEVSSQSYNDKWLKADIVLTTPSLEVGIDVDTIVATLHYRAPRTIFSFIQRRGRAGRKLDKAFTFVVLGNTSMDNFFFYKRHRLLDENRYDLPLNPHNDVIKKMHNKLIEHREKIVNLFREKNESAQEVIYTYIIEFLLNCDLIKNVYINEIKTFIESEDFNDFRNKFKEWIKKEKNNMEEVLNVEYILKSLEEESPDNKKLLEKISELREAIRKGNYSKIEEIKEHISDILLDIARDIKNTEGRDAYRRFEKDTKNKLEELLDKIKVHKLHKSIINRIENYYLFFKTLYDKLEIDNLNWNWKSNSIPEIVKAIFQATFYLHLGINPNKDKDCLFNDVDFYLPDAFFQEVKPIVIEINRGNGRYDLVLEDSSLLEFMLIPYKPIHRYSGDTFLNVINTGTNELENVHKESDNVVKIKIPIKTDYIKGVDKGESFEVSALTVKFLRTDDKGKQTLKLCPECFNLYSFNRKKTCHGKKLLNVRLKTEPITEKFSETCENSYIEKTKLFSLTKLSVESRILGSDVKVYRVNVTDKDIFPTANVIYELKVKYEKPLSYKLITKGIIWKIPQEILQDIRNTKEREKLLHTGAHILLKVVASLGGVHEQMLQYSFDVEKGEVKVWERYEGGIGIVDTVFRKLKEDPFSVYKEFLSVVLCPIYLSDRIKVGELSVDKIPEYIYSEWHIGKDDELIKEICDEVEQELSIEYDENTITCKDGCPVCVYVNYCQSGFAQENEVSRSLGERLIKSFIKEKRIDALDENELAHVLVRKKDSAIILNL